MDRTFHDIQANIAKRLLHSDRLRRRKSLGPDIVTSSCMNNDISRLKMKNEILFKDLEGHLSGLELAQRRRHDEMTRSEKALTMSRKYRRNSLPIASKNDELGNAAWIADLKAKGKLSVLAKHLNSMKNEISMSEERLGRWREKVCETSMKSKTQTFESTSGKLGETNTQDVSTLLTINEESVARGPDLDQKIRKTSTGKSSKFSQCSHGISRSKIQVHQKTSSNTLPPVESTEGI